MKGSGTAAYCGALPADQADRGSDGCSTPDGEECDTARTAAPPRRDAGLPRFFTSVQGELHAYFARRLGDRETAAELVQDSFLRFTRVRYSPDSGYARALIFGIARNLFTDHLRRRRRQGLLGFDEANRIDADALGELAAGDADPEQTISAQQELDRAIAAIQALPAKCRRVFIMHRLHGASHKEIASELGISVSMVEKHIIEATARLVSALADTACSGS